MHVPGAIRNCAAIIIVAAAPSSRHIWQLRYR